MKQALFVVSGMAIGLLAALMAVTFSKADVLSRAEAQAGPMAETGPEARRFWEPGAALRIKMISAGC